MKKIKNMFSRSKAAIVATGVMVIGAVEASAAVVFDGLTQTFSGSFDLTPFYSAIGIIVVAIAIVAGIRLAFRSFKSV
jgi:hypothetical protein